MGLKKLVFSEEDKMEIKKLRKELSQRIIDSPELSKIYAGTTIEGGCGEQCMITCAHWCEHACDLSCTNTCTMTCVELMAVIGKYFLV